MQGSYIFIQMFPTLLVLTEPRVWNYYYLKYIDKYIDFVNNKTQSG